jgi:hypothetical protein
MLIENGEMGPKDHDRVFLIYPERDLETTYQSRMTFATSSHQQQLESGYTWVSRKTSMVLNRPNGIIADFSHPAE